jgi:polyhydroxyalkanoate synthesis regulator phasin
VAQRGVSLASKRQDGSAETVRAELVARLRARSAEIEEAIFARIWALSDPIEIDDPEYRTGLRATVAETIRYAIWTIERGQDSAAPIPPAAAAQARLAARSGVRLDTVLRRYAAGDRLLGEFIMEETRRFPSEALRRVLHMQGPQVDRLMAAVAAEYMDEAEQIRRSPAQRLGERVQRLLAGEQPRDVESLEYELDAWHLGLVVAGARAEAAANALASGLSRAPLVVSRGNGVAWAWLGGRRPLAVSDVERHLSADLLGEVSLAVGEPRYGLKGWRLTHREAQAARLVMLRRPRRFVRASEVTLLAAILGDDSLAKSLRASYLAPLDELGDSGRVLRDTVRAYFAAGFNAAAAAASLKIDRHTVQRRLRKVEEALGRLLHECHAEIEVALSLEELDEAA